MYSTSTHAPCPAPAPWRSAFLSHLSQMDKPEFVLSTLHPTSSSGQGIGQSTGSAGAETEKVAAATPSWEPRARFCIFRGFWAELPENKHNAAERNEGGVYASEMPTFTTDVRMEKIGELFASSTAGRAEDAAAAAAALTLGSGGGGACEAVFWAKEAMVQWRMKGTAWVVGPDVEGKDGGKAEGDGVRTMKSEVGARMRVEKEEGIEDWSWARELRAHFGNIAPRMRGSFRAPPPGRPVSDPYDDTNLAPGQKIEDLDDAVARGNFRVVIIKPDEVQSVDLNDPKTSRRHVYRFSAKTGEWSDEECWP